MPAKKTTASKSTKSPAPATKPARVAAPKKAKSTKVAKTSPAVVTPTELAVAALATVTPPKTVVSTPVTTTVTATINIGFGNTLFIRGEGPGLSWDVGVPMNCIGAEQWQIVLGEAARPFTFKFLVNDLSWSTGADYTTGSGASVVLTPQF